MSRGIERRDVKAQLARAGLALAVSQRYPQLSVEACLGIEAILLEQISNAIASGQQLGILEERPDGSVSISVFVIDEVVEQVTNAR